MHSLVGIGFAGLDEVKVEKAVLVVVDPCNARAHGFEVVLFVRLGGILNERDTRGLANVRKANRNGRVVRLGRLLSVAFVKGRRAHACKNDEGRAAAGKVAHRVRSASESASCRNCARSAMEREALGVVDVAEAWSRTCSMRSTSRLELALVFLNRLSTSRALPI